MSPSFIQILIVVILLVLLFGRGKISGLMGDVAKGIKSFKKGMAEDPDAEPQAQVEKQKAQNANEPIDVTPSTKKDEA